MKVLPQAMATGYIHNGTMAGKLNGVIPATTPKGFAVAVSVDIRADVAAEISLEQMRDAANEIHHLDAASDLAQRVRVSLAMLGADAAGNLLAMLIQQAP